MKYFDSDFLVNYFVIQNRKKHLLAEKLFDKTNRNEQVFTSLLNLQETSFVLAKLRIGLIEINEILSTLHKFKPINYTLKEYLRACELCQKVGFQNINDCLHTAIAESHCDEFYTFNESDFRQIQKYTSLKINILKV